MPRPRTTGSANVAINLGASAADLSCLTAHPTSSGANLAFFRGRYGSCSAATGYSYLTADPTSAADPSATASFGIYSAESKKFMHIRELF